MLLDDIPPAVYPLVGDEEREGDGGGVAGAQSGQAGRLALPGLPGAPRGHPARLLVFLRLDARTEATASGDAALVCWALLASAS